MIPKKADLVDNYGKPLTQSLFLELGYSEFAIYTFKDTEHEYKGKKYPSIKQAYLAMEDPTEYEFATTYFLGWNHWKRLLENKNIRREIDEWRDELEIKLRCKAVKAMLDSAKQGNYQASKWFADRGWINKGAGRPSREDVLREKEFQSRAAGEYGADVLRLFGNEK